ncbi:hypothetical protein F4806DRAFT_494311 [Annulohypoxylon nitens]|nr:hypothetical protein F4806DRAFT_494311 [Annulohypoxylon nitens]
MTINILQIFTQQGWRRTGFINVLLVLVCGIVLLICLILSLKTGSSLNGTTIIYSGHCNDTSNLDIILHLLLNLLATGVLTSSNFFMQVVASPSREEVNTAHASFLSLDIGVLSTKNLRHISYFKGSSWVILVLSSLPIHLFLNSSIFETNYQGSNWHLTVATEAFTKGGDFFPPGASLAPAGSSYPSYVYKYDSHIYFFYYEDRMVPVVGYGVPVPLDLYGNKTSVVEQNITRTAALSSNWERLDINTCRNEYTLCKPRSRYRDMVLVVESDADDPRGWRREEVFNLTHNASLQWDKYVPQGVVNSLWYSTQCTVRRYPQINSGICYQSCGGVFGHEDIYGVPISESFPTDWAFTLQSFSNVTLLENDANFKFNDRFWNLTVRYCLAEPELTDCKIGISNILLMVVIICIFAKLGQCSIILWKLPRSSLVTLGDTMESFIRGPDFRTVGLGTLDIIDVRRLETQSRHHCSPEDETLTYKIKPRRWFPTNRRYLTIISRAVWARTYGLLLVSLAVITVFLQSCYTSNNSSFKGSFGYSDNVQITYLEIGFISQLIVTNTPQILLSLSYFSYSGFFTRLQAEKEWNSYSQKFQPLRVSYPMGKQISSYRLQLPYKYSIPLFCISVLCHWLLSNAFFLFIMVGGYGASDYSTSNTNNPSYFHVSDDSLIALGYSPPAILSLFIVACLLVPLPLLLSLRKPQGKMVAGASNSLVISAACHCRVSSLSNNDAGMNGSNHADAERSQIDDQQQEISTHHRESRDDLILLQDLVGCDLGPGSSSENHSQVDLVRGNGDAGGFRSLEEDNSTPMAEDLDQWEEKLRILSQSEIKWGAMALPIHLADAMGDVRRETVMHLGLGDESCNIKSPGEGECVPPFKYFTGPKWGGGTALSGPVETDPDQQSRPGLAPPLVRVAPSKARVLHRGSGGTLQVTRVWPAKTLSAMPDRAR